MGQDCLYKKVYAGTGEELYSLFEVEERDIEVFSGLESYNKICRTRLLDLYQKIKRYI